MNKEQYVTFEVGKLLKDKGFDWDCEHYYKPNGEIVRTFHANGSHNINSSVLYENQCLAPTQQMACRWLREEKSVWVTHRPLDYDYGVDGLAYIKTPDNEWLCAYTCTKDSVEDAIEAALEYALTNLI